MGHATQRTRSAINANPQEKNGEGFATTTERFEDTGAVVDVGTSSTAVRRRPFGRRRPLQTGRRVGREFRHSCIPRKRLQQGAHCVKGPTRGGAIPASRHGPFILIFFIWVKGLTWNAPVQGSGMRGNSCPLKLKERLKWSPQIEGAA